MSEGKEVKAGRGVRGIIRLAQAKRGKTGKRPATAPKGFGLDGRGRQPPANDEEEKSAERLSGRTFSRRLAALSRKGFAARMPRGADVNSA